MITNTTTKLCAPYVFNYKPDEEIIIMKKKKKNPLKISSENTKEQATLYTSRIIRLRIKTNLKKLRTVQGRGASTVSRSRHISSTPARNAAW